MQQFITHEYANTEDIILREYGRIVQKMALHLLTIEDREKRSNLAITLIDLMKQVHPTYRDMQDINNKIWDDLYIITHFELDVDAPYPKPDPKAVGKPPQTVAYNNNNLRFRHYGRNVELLIEKSLTMTDAEEQKTAISFIARMMKTFYITWNKDNVDDKTIINHIDEYTKGKLLFDLNELREAELERISASKTNKQTGYNLKNNVSNTTKTNTTKTNNTTNNVNRNKNFKNNTTNNTTTNGIKTNGIKNNNNRNERTDRTR